MTKTKTKKFCRSAAGFLTAVFMACPALATTLPTGGTVTGGSATFDTTVSNKLTINQATQNALIDWSGFDIGDAGDSDAHVVFNQPRTTSITVNRITSSSASQIYGSLSANGNLVLINQKGITFNKGSTVSVGGLVATTSDYDSGFDQDTKKVKIKYKDGSDPAAKIINNGQITTTGTVNSSGLVALVAPSVENGSDGVITATAGKVQLEAGDTFEVDFYGDGLLNLATNGAVTELLVKNSGKISADGGLVRMTADTAGSVVDGLINMDGIIEANATATANGEVKLVADAIELKNGAKIEAKGGSISLTGTGATRTHNIGVSVDNATIDAGEGTIKIAGLGYNGDATKTYIGHSYGVSIANGSTVTVTGKGTIDIDGTGGDGVGKRNPVVAGFNHGVYITGTGTSVSAENGLLSIEGHGGGRAASASSHDYGVFVSGGADVSTFSGAIDIVGYGGGCGEKCGYNYGVYITDAGSKVASTNGDINILGFGHGGASSVSNYGVYVTNYGDISNANGEITITGVGGGTGTEVNDNYGIVVTDHASIGGTSDVKDVSFITDEIWMDATPIIRTTADVSFEPYTNSTTIGVAGGAGDLQITSTILDDVFGARSITVGNYTRDTGLMTVGSYNWNTNARLLNLDGDIVFSGTQTMGGSTLLAYTMNKNITIEAGGGATSTATGDAITLAASAGTFTNYAGAGALSAPNGRWLVYSYSPVGDTFGDLNSGNTAIWHTVFYDGFTLLPSQDNNRYVFAIPMTVTVTLADLSKIVGQDYTFEVAHDGYSKIEGLSPGVLNAFLPDTLATATTGTAIITSPGAPSPAAVGSYPIDMTGLTGVNGYTFFYNPGTLTVTDLSINEVLEFTKAYGKRTTYGTLLAIVNTPGYLANLAPQAGGNMSVGDLANLAPKAGGNMSPEDLANLAPKAGGSASITPLIQCNEVTPCESLQ